MTIDTSFRPARYHESYHNPRPLLDPLLLLCGILFAAQNKGNSILNESGKNTLRPSVSSKCLTFGCFMLPGIAKDT